MSSPANTPQALTVTELTMILKGVVEEVFAQVDVTGEISNLVQAASGHIYFTLKDEQSLLKCVMWRSAAAKLRFRLADGLQVVLRGSLEVYAPRGHYQLSAQTLVPVGVGAQELAFRQLCEKLSAEGLFDPARKRPIPRFPRQVAIVTSLSGAALRDILQVLSRRWPGLAVTILPVAVQGSEAIPLLLKAFRNLAGLQGVDVVIVGRGGGSSEDLWAFNDERVARAISNCAVPTISAVGHEIDVTVADLVADRRALTPTEAAELAVPNRAEVRQDLIDLASRMVESMNRRSHAARMSLDAISERSPFARPQSMISTRRQLLDESSARLPQAMSRILESHSAALGQIASSLDALSPLAVLGRGYSLTKRVDTDDLVRSVSQVVPGYRLSTLLADGEILSEILEVHSDNDNGDGHSDGR